jgi:hypothetical protein
MGIDAGIAKRSKAHQRYHTTDGTPVPGVTTIIGNIAKPSLIPWANRLGLDGIDSVEYVRKTARIGTLAHEMIQEHLGGEMVEKEQYSEEEVDRAENSFRAFLEWENRLGMPLSTIFTEKQLVSDIEMFGGSVDWYGMIGGERWLIDIKTSDVIYPEHIYQVSAYARLLLTHDYPVDGVRILRVDRSETESYEDRVVGDGELALGWEVFVHARRMYEAIRKYQKRSE